MEKVRPWCGQPSDRGRLKNRTESYTKYSKNKSKCKTQLMHMPAQYKSPTIKNVIVIER